ncbi:MAG: hypothetical protein R3Y63_08840 [Eubacteriales bacterium]
MARIIDKLADDKEFLALYIAVLMLSGKNSSFNQMSDGFNKIATSLNIDMDEITAEKKYQKMKKEFLSCFKKEK